MNSSSSTVQSSSPSSDETTRNSRPDSLQSRSTEHLSVSGLSQNANGPKFSIERSTSSSSVPLGTLNSQVRRLDDQPGYPYPEPYSPLEVSSPDPAPSLFIPNPLQSSPPLEFAHPARLDHGEELELRAPEGPCSEVSADANVPLSLALRQLELWDEVPPDFPQQVALFLAQGAGQETQKESGPEISSSQEETSTDSTRAGIEKEDKEDEAEEEEVITVQLDLNPELAAAVQTSILQHSKQQKLIAFINAPRALAEELQRRTIEPSDVDKLPSIDSVLQGTRTRKLVFGVQLFQELT